MGTGENTPRAGCLRGERVGRDSALSPRIRLQLGLIRQSKDWLSTEFIFLAISHTL